MKRRNFFIITTVILIGCIFLFYFISELNPKSLVNDMLVDNDKHVEKINAATVTTIDENLRMKDLSEEELAELKRLLQTIEVKKAWGSKRKPNDYILTIRGSNVHFHLDISKDGLISLDEGKKEVFKITNKKVRESLLKLVNEESFSTK